MELSAAERLIVERFGEKARIAGGPRPGYMLRKAAVLYVRDEHPHLDLEAALAGLVEKGLLKVNEGGNLYYLSAAGAELLGAPAKA